MLSVPVYNTWHVRQRCRLADQQPDRPQIEALDVRHASMYAVPGSFQHLQQADHKQWKGVY